MKQTALLLGLHCHQPVDNFHHVLYEAIEKSYHPFFEVASGFPEFKFSVHYSGWLLEFIRDKAPETFSLMQTLSQNGQIEFLTGGYYEPILASISSKDRIAQIGKLNSFIEEHFNQSPKGLWLTERVWDSVIIKDVASLGVEYVVVDDYHFISSGFDKERLNGYFITEDEGVKLKIFPINKELRYTMPFAKPDKVCDYLESIAEDDISAGVIFDDGEKFGIWPETYEWVYEKGWLKEFIQKSLANDAIKPMLYREYLEVAKPISLAYLPITSYIEMGGWSLKGEDANILHKMQSVCEDSFDIETIEKFLKGSVWKNFLVKYYEANKIHKRYIDLSRDRIDNVDYLESLYKAQTNDALWHGVFGGTYLPNLRDNAYRFIIDCENIKYFEQTAMEVKDISCDGFDEVKCVSGNLITIFDSKVGGQLIEFDIRDRSFNLQNTMSRYYESYHQKIMDFTPKTDEIFDIEEEIVEEAIATIHGDDSVDLSEYQEVLNHDWYTKNSFIDHVSDVNISLSKFSSCKFDEYGDFVNQPFEIVKCEDTFIHFQREGNITLDGVQHRAVLDKSFQIGDSIISFEIQLQSDLSGDLRYLQEHNLHFANLKDITINSRKFDENLILVNCDRVEIYDSYTGKTIIYTLSRRVGVYLCRLDTLSQSEAGFDLTNQGLSIGFVFELTQNTSISGLVEVL
jgi:alpha-amylase/alpha-mannosidase (GH57 family)